MQFLNIFSLFLLNDFRRHFRESRHRFHGHQYHQSNRIVCCFRLRERITRLHNAPFPLPPHFLRSLPTSGLSPVADQMSQPLEPVEQFVLIYVQVGLDINQINTILKNAVERDG